MDGKKIIRSKGRGAETVWATVCAPEYVARLLVNAVRQENRRRRARGIAPIGYEIKIPGG